MTRRELLALGAAAPLVVSRNAWAKEAPAAPVAIAKVPDYSEYLVAAIEKMFDQIGGAGRLVKNKTVSLKLNLTGSPGNRFQGRPLGSTHYTHPKTITAMVDVLDKAGAKRIRLIEGCFQTTAPLEEFMLDSGWNVRQLQGLTKTLEFENTNFLGSGKQYSRLKVPGGGYVFPAYDLNHSYEDTDVLVSMAKLKNHATCGVTLSMKNMFGITPTSIYGDDAGADGPNEKTATGRVSVCHMGKRGPAKSAPQEIDPSASRAPGYRMPRIVAELNAARPVNIAFIEGIETVTGGEGPWIRGLKYVKPGVMLLGTNAVNVDSVATAVMGYDPRAPKGKFPFVGCDNSLLLAEALGVGSADLKKIEVTGASIESAKFDFGPNETPAV
jgi:uncharacterized protein (DUF362 family)